MKHTFLILLTSLAFSCTHKLYVAPNMADCNIAGRTECYLIKSSTEGNWIMMAEDIIGFEFEEGFVYRVLVKKIKTEDEFGTLRDAYELVEILEKKPYTKKNITTEDG